MTAHLDELALRVQLAAFPGPTLTPEAADLLATGLGGICLFGSNTADGPDAVARLAAAVHAASPRAVVAIDEEGGDVTRLHVATGSPVLGPGALGAADDLALTRDTGRLVGAELAAVGVDLDLGPVADVNTNPDNPVIGTRSFGTDPRRVADHVVAWLQGLQETGVAACAKHFPGHGDTSTDSHLALPIVDVDLEVLAGRELVPFAAAVDAGVAAVMTSHLLVPAVDDDLPATLSPRVLALLRGRPGLHRRDRHRRPRHGRRLRRAGHPRGRRALARRGRRPALSRRRQGRRPGARGPASSRRGSALGPPPRGETGRRRGPRRPAAPPRVELARRPRTDQLAGARRAVTVEGALPDLRGAAVVSIATRANIAIGDAAWGLPADDCLDPTEPDRRLAGDGPLVVQVRDAHRRPEVGALVADLAATRPVVVVEWGWPGPYDDRTPRICTRGSSLPAVAAVREVLASAGWDG